MPITCGFRHFSRSIRPASRGIALISTLAIVAIVTILLVSFASVVNQDRGATQNYGQGIRADEIARGGLDTLVGMLRQEATEGAFNDYTNTTGTNAMRAWATPGPNVTNMSPQKFGGRNFPNIVSYSGANLYETNNQGVKLPSVDASTISNSLNNRSVSISRWNKPRLLEQTNGFTPPLWIPVTRSGVVKGLDFNAATNSGTTNDSYVVGRYAYVIYDVSGLIDINVAGHLDGAISAAKGLLPWADLTQLTNGIDVGKLIAWRNPGTGTSATNYNNYIQFNLLNATNGAMPTNTWSASGFLRVTNGDNTFLSRQDLINYASQTNSPLPVPALPYLTTFSRELNGPVWGPAANQGYDYFNQRLGLNTVNPLIYKAVATANTGRQYYQDSSFAAGEPTAKYRFPLNRLSLLEAQNASNPTGGNEDLIARFFGLDKAPGSAGLYRRWAYPTVSEAYVHNSTPRGTSPNTYIIMTLDEVAALPTPREPDFFELLKAGILAGSLGMVGRGDPAGADPNDPDRLADGQIIQIGANIIDQWDADNYPTTITFPLSTGTEYYGVEDLPYIEQVFFGFKKGDDPSNGDVPTTYMYFTLWNPHQPPSAASPSATLKNLQVTVLKGSVTDIGRDIGSYRLFYGMHSGDPLNPDIWTLDQDKGPGWILFNGGVAQEGAEASRPSTLTPTGINFTINPLTSYRNISFLTNGANFGGGADFLPTDATINALTLESYRMTVDDGTESSGASHTAWPAHGPPPDYTLYLSFANVSIALLFQDPNTPSQYHPYGMFTGVVSNTLGYAGLTFAYGGWYPVLEFAPAGTAAAANYSLVKADPRTRRWGASWAMSPSAANLMPPPNPIQFLPGMRNNAVAKTIPISPTPYTNFFKVSGGGSLTEGTPYRLTQWAKNLSSGAYYVDPDGSLRPGDYYTVGSASPYTNAGSGPVSPGDFRPLVLNRPFTSVADMGYAFRDMPWKTLDFSSAQSADAGLLDLFTIEEGPVVAGRVNPNAADTSVIAALLAGAPRNVMASSPTALTASEASDVASTFGNLPALSRADIVAVMTNSAVSNATPWPKTEREAIVRALAESANTRTWNLMIDVIAQAGRYPATATKSGGNNWDNFVVTGERRYWLHVAIDRYTGQVIDQQLERVGE